MPAAGPRASPGPPPAPLAIRIPAGGHTEWFRGVQALLRQRIGVLAQRGYRVLPLDGWLRAVLERRADRLHEWTLAALAVDGRGEWTVPEPAQRRVRDALDACAALDIDLATRLAIMDEGKCVAMGRPEELKSQISGDVLTLTTREPEKVTETLRSRFDLASTAFDHTVRLEHPRGAEFIPELVAALPNLVDSVSLSKPSLQDVFLRTTGRRFASEER